MGNILEFPSQQTQQLAYLERELRQLLLAKGADSDLIEHAVKQLSDLYGRVYNTESKPVSVTLPPGIDPVDRERLAADIDGQLEAIYKDNHRLVLELAAQLLLAQVKLFQHERNS